MSKVDKIIFKMRNQPNGIRFDELAKLLLAYGYLEKKNSGTSHRNFINAKGDVITIVHKNPVKAAYVKEILRRLKINKEE